MSDSKKTPLWQAKPYPIEVEADSSKAYCQCGKTSTPPFCDGSHKGTGVAPIVEKYDESKTVYACGCGHTGGPPYCDGTHNKLDTLDASAELIWYKVAERDQLREGEVTVVNAGELQIALSLRDGVYGAVQNACPHQGGPLGEGTLDANNCVACPWHGWTFDRVTGRSEYDDHIAAFEIDVRDDGIYVQAPDSTEDVTTVADVMMQTMVDWGVTHVFGMVGHSNLGVAEAIRKLEEAGKITYIGIRHEGAAAFAASGFAKSSGRPAACLAIAGPGATNMLTGIWDAKVDRHPVLALTGQVNTQVLGPGSFQELPLASAFEAATLWNETVLPNSDHVELMNQAMKRALIESGPTHLIFPDEVQTMPLEETTTKSGPAGRVSESAISPPEDAVAEALALIGEAKRPSIIVGHGAREGMSDIIALAESIHAPVITTFKAKGYISDAHPLATGVLGRSGTPVAANRMSESDLLVVFGASFAVHTGISPKIKTIQVDRDRMTLGKFHPVTVPVWGDISVTAQALRDKSIDANAHDPREALAAAWKDWREEKAKRAAKNNGNGISSARLFEILSDRIPADAVISVDVGNNTYSFGRYFECSGEQTILMSGYLGSIGFGFPAAMGAWAAHPERPIFGISGDGGFGQYLAEFTTAVKYNMNLTHVLLNNGELGKISKEQLSGQWPVWQTDLRNPDFAQFAENCGGRGIRVESEDAIGAALDEAASTNGPVLIEVLTDPKLI